MTGTARNRNTRNLPRNYFTDAQTCAPSSSPELGNSAEGVHGAGGGERSHAAGNIPTPQQLREYADGCRTQRLHAARVISGRAQK